jgi:hypothetical protein
VLGGRVGLLTAGGLAEIASPSDFVASTHPEVRELVATLDPVRDG